MFFFPIEQGTTPVMQAALDSFNNAKNLPKIALYKGPVTEEMKRREAEETEVRVAKEKAEHEARYAEAKAAWRPNWSKRRD